MKFELYVKRLDGENEVSENRSIEIESIADADLPIIKNIAEPLFELEEIELKATESVSDFDIFVGEEKLPKEQKFHKKINSTNMKCEIKEHSVLLSFNEFVGFTSLTIKKQNDVICRYDFEVLPSKMAQNHFYKMMEEVHNVLLINEKKKFTYGIFKNKFIDSNDSLYDHLILLKPFINKIIYSVNIVMHNPIKKESNIISPLLNTDRKRLSKSSIKQSCKRGLDINNINSIKNLHIIQTYSIIDKNLLYILEKSLSMLINECNKIYNKLESNKDKLNFKLANDYREEIKESIEKLSRKKLQLIRVFKLKNNNYRGKNIILLPLSWKASQNIYYKTIYNTVKELTKHIANPNVDYYREFPLNKISELYEYWLVLKIRQQLGMIFNIDFNNIFWKDGNNKKIIKDDPNTDALFTGDIDNYSIHLRYEDFIENISYYEKQVKVVKKKKKLENIQNKIDNLKFSILRDGKENINKITPDYVINIFKKDNIPVNDNENYYYTNTPDKSIIFDAKYKQFTEVEKDCNDVIIKKSYDQIGIRPFDNRVKHTWLFCPGVKIDLDSNKPIYSEKGINIFPWIYNDSPNSPDVTSAGWVGLRPEYGDIKEGEYNVDYVLNIFLTKLFKIEGILK